MGRGDRRTKRGKISSGSFGKVRLARRTAKLKNSAANIAAINAAAAAKQD